MGAQYTGPESPNLTLSLKNSFKKIQKIRENTNTLHFVINLQEIHVTSQKFTKNQENQEK